MEAKRRRAEVRRSEGQVPQRRGKGVERGAQQEPGVERRSGRVRVRTVKGTGAEIATAGGEKKRKRQRGNDDGDGGDSEDAVSRTQRKNPKRSTKRVMRCFDG